MSFGKNIQFMRELHNKMTQEELAEKLGVSRQTISKWEMDAAFPEMEKAITLSRLFNCSIDELLKDEMNSSSKFYHDIKIMKVKAFQYTRYIVVSADPEGDAIKHLTMWAEGEGIDRPDIIGWDFPYLSQEQINVFHMHGYCAACILPQEWNGKCQNIKQQPATKYAVLTIEEPFDNPFVLIPNAYTTLRRYIEVNGLKHVRTQDVIECFEKTYVKNGHTYMDVNIAVS